MTKVEEMKLTWQLWWAGVRRDMQALGWLLRMARLAWPCRSEPTTDQVHQDVIDTLAWITALCSSEWTDSHESRLTRDTLDEIGLPRLYWAQVRLISAILTTATGLPERPTSYLGGDGPGEDPTEAQLKLLQGTAVLLHAVREADFEQQARFMGLHPSAGPSAANS